MSRPGWRPTSRRSSATWTERNAIAARELSDRIFTVLDKLTRDEFEGPAQTLVSGEVNHRRSGLSRIMSP